MILLILNIIISWCIRVPFALYDFYNRYEKIFESGVPSTEDYEKFLEPKILNYQIGNMVLFKGNLLHQIAPFFEPVCENELRITLQGHGLKCDGKWILYF
jgi:hypothetical protein